MERVTRLVHERSYLVKILKIIPLPGLLERYRECASPCHVQGGSVLSESNTRSFLSKWPKTVWSPSSEHKPGANSGPLSAWICFSL